jgi:hypothetical protein
MTEPPVLSAVGIEGVQWLPGRGENMIVRVRGRWRRGRPPWSGQPLLVIESVGGLHRFPAVPEPPGLSGAAPGTWEMTFSVPSSLSPQTGMEAWLQLGGGVVVPLRVPTEPTASDEETQSAAAPAPQRAAERVRSAELAAEAARRRAVEAEAAVIELANRLEQLEHERAGRQFLPGIRDEFELSRRGLLAVTRPQARALPSPRGADLLERERAQIRARFALGARTASLERELREQRARSTRAYEAIEALRGELEALWALAQEQAAATEAARAAEELPPTQKTQPAAAEGSEDEPPAPVPAPPRPGSNRWLERALHRLARRSPALAGRLLVALVPGAEMDEERLIRLLGAGPLQRRIRRVGGEAASFEALERRLAERTSLADLRLEPGLSLALAAVMIEPRWTAGEQFTLAYQLPSGGRPGPYLEVHDGKPVTVSDTPYHAPPATTVECPADQVAAVLAGEQPDGTRIIGEAQPLARVRQWLDRAQSD